ncbi:ArsR/SmtB family transcription factor [Halorientalis litorea]|jgi:DNA-binding transcriptional ArsR family regulator|uniref:ArsR/SmtB family transcription factor n=1 Tax=Halorientalis litorea TaxID=2931977 RepID=UPI001FF44B51|nr:helix-turn-helix domain-containing protein [Halorientalis litorea]
MSLLPSEPDTSAADEADPRVIGVDSEAADDVLSALTAETGRELLSELHDDPAPPAELAERVDTSLQNAQYHLNKLQEAGAIEVIDTMYSEKGREMNVYAPADQPLVIFAGNEEQSTGIRAALSRLLSSLGILALASVAVQEVFGGGIGTLIGFGAQSGAGGDSGAAPAAATDTPTESPTPTPEGGDGGGVGAMDAETETPAETTEAAEAATETAREALATEVPDAETTQMATEAATDTALSLPPGLVFFLGGLTAMALVGGVWYLRR